MNLSHAFAIIIIISQSAAFAQEPATIQLRPPDASAETVTPDQYEKMYSASHPGYKKVVTGIIITKKEMQRKEEQARNDKSDAEYKVLKVNHQLPNAFLHPLKRGDAWIDYHEDSYRKFRTRTLPATQFVATIFGAGCAAVAAFK